MTDAKAIYNMLGLDWEAVNMLSEQLDYTQEIMTAKFGKDEKETIASSFLAILELVRDNKVVATQKDSFDDILIEEKKD